MFFRNAFIFTRDASFVHGSFRVENGKFAEVFCTAVNGDGIDLNGAFVIPGLVDIHIHGNSGADFSDGDRNGLITMARYLAKNGVTSFAPASMTLPYEILEAAFINASGFEHERAGDCSRLMGIHMEGPFFSEKKKGAQNGAFLKLPDYIAFKRLYDASNGLLRIVDIAPELKGAQTFTALVSKLCTVSAAHTDADYEEAKAVFSAGATHLTHLFNAMPPLHHRSPGVIGAAAEQSNVIAELICDGHHVHESAVRMAFKLFPRRICLISDALRCCGAIALEAFRITGELLGYALADAVTITSPEAIFLFGGLAKSGKYIFEPTQWYMEENMMSVFKNKVKLLPSGIQSQNAAILGASALIWQEVKQLGA